MGKPLKTFCCGCTLRFGTLVIGVTLALNGLVSLGLFIHFYTSDFSTLINDRNSYDNPDYKIVPSFDPLLRVLLTVLAGLSAVQLFINILLIIGTLKHKPVLVDLWFKFYIVLIALNLIADILNAILYFNITASGSTGIVFSLIGTIANLVVTAYAMLVVHAYHETMDMNRNRYNRGEPALHGQGVGPSHGLINMG